MEIVMKKMLKRVLSAIMAAACVCTCLAGCGKKVEESSGTKVVIYCAGSKVSGANDAAVKKAIEKKFKEDTGNEINLEIKLFTNADFNTKVDLAIAGGDQIDGIVNYIGSSDALDRFISRNNFATDLTELVNEYGTHLKSVIPEIAFDHATYDGQLAAIPSVTQENAFGILIRTDWLKEANLEIPTTISEFETVMEAFKKRDGNVVPLVGYSWDLDRVILAGAYGTVSSSYYYLDDSGTLLPGFLNPKYKNVLSKCYEWVKSGWWDIDNASRTESSIDNLFVGGRAGIYVQYPEIYHLIEIARKCKQADSKATFEVIGPLEGPNGDKGVQKQNVAFSGMMVPKSSKNAELVVKYMDWMVSDVKNYELCAYGIEGTDWVDSGEGKRGLPDKNSTDVVNMYSGCYAPIEFTNLSDRVWDTYSEQELGWIEAVRSYPTFSDAREGVFFPYLDNDMSSKYSSASTDFQTNTLSPARAGLKDTSKTFESAVEAFKLSNKDYLEWMNQYYKENKKTYN